MVAQKSLTADPPYQVVLADTINGRRIHGRVRYTVFCREKGFEDEQRFPDGEEFDHWDSESVHFVVRESSSGTWVGAMRMVLPGPRGFPLEGLNCLHSEYRPALLPAGVCEISRLCLVKGANAGSAAFGVERRFGPVGAGVQANRDSEIMLALLRAALAYSEQNGIEHWYVLINAAFARLLTRMGVKLRAAGDACEHRGMRRPYVVDLQACRDYVAECGCRVATVLRSHGQPFVHFSDLFGEAEAPARRYAAEGGAGRILAIA